MDKTLKFAHAVIEQLGRDHIDPTLERLRIHYSDYYYQYPSTPASPRLIDLIITEKDGNGLTIAQIKRKYRLTDSHIQQALYRPDRTKRLPIATEIIHELTHTTKTQAEIAKEFHTSRSYVCKLARTVERPPNTKKANKEPVALTDQQKLEIRSSKLSYTVLAAKYNVSLSTIYRVNNADNTAVH